MGASDIPLQHCQQNMKKMGVWKEGRAEWKWSEMGRGISLLRGTKRMLRWEVVGFLLFGACRATGLTLGEERREEEHQKVASLQLMLMSALKCGS